VVGHSCSIASAECAKRVLDTQRLTRLKILPFARCNQNVPSRGRGLEPADNRIKDGHKHLKTPGQDCKLDFTPVPHSLDCRRYMKLIYLLQAETDQAAKGDLYPIQRFIGVVDGSGAPAGQIDSLWGHPS
jgi:hypothetical protein